MKKIFNKTFLKKIFILGIMSTSLYACKVKADDLDRPNINLNNTNIEVTNNTNTNNINNNENTDIKVENGITIQMKTIHGPTIKHVLDDEIFYQNARDNFKPLETKRTSKDLK